MELEVWAQRAPNIYISILIYNFDLKSVNWFQILDKLEKGVIIDEVAFLIISMCFRPALIFAIFFICLY